MYIIIPSGQAFISHSLYKPKDLQVHSELEVFKTLGAMSCYTRYYNSIVGQELVVFIFVLAFYLSILCKLAQHYTNRSSIQGVLFRITIILRFD